MWTSGAGFERLRSNYRPNRIRVLFVGESPPSGGTFFYDDEHPSKLRRVTEELMRDVLGRRVGPDFLESFARLGCYLDDLCLKPINQLGDGARDVARRRGEASLAKRMGTMQPAAVVGIGIGCRQNFKRAHRAAAIQAPLDVLPFPNWQRDVDRYTNGLTERLRELDRAGHLSD